MDKLDAFQEWIIPIIEAEEQYDRYISEEAIKAADTYDQSTRGRAVKSKRIRKGKKGSRE